MSDFIYAKPLFVKRVLCKLTNISFQLRVFLLLLCTSLVVLFALERFLTYNFERYQAEQFSKTAMNQAKIIASMDSVIQAVKDRDEKTLASVANKLRLSSDFSYVVIGDENSIRLFHPTDSKIGYPMQWNKPGALENKESYVITSEGSIGMALRAKTPIFDENQNVIGVVSLGYLISKIDHWRMTYIFPIIMFFGVMLVLLSFFSWWFSIHIKRQMMGMEPKEIARVQRQQEALFGAVFEGLLAVDPQGNITAINQNARKMLNLKQETHLLLGRSVSEVVTPDSFFLEQNGDNYHDVMCTFNGISVIANRAGIWLEETFQGWIVSFRLKNDIYTLSAQLSQIQQYVENLRTVRHEHLNWMSTLSGLLQMKEYDRALEMVKVESSNQQTLIDTIRNMFHKAQVSALLFGKYHRAKELGLELVFAPGCCLSSIPDGLSENEFSAILANLLDNAFEATLKNPDSNKLIELYLSDEGSDYIIEVADTGCGIEPEICDQIFTRGISSKKEKDHGIGLYLVATYVEQSGGEITIEDNQPSGVRFTVFIPKVRIINEES